MRASVACLRLFGGLRLTTLCGQEIEPRGLKARAMLAYLAMAPAGQVDRGRLSGMLWSAGVDAKASLRQALREARQALGSVSNTLLCSERLRVSLDLERVWVDVLEAERLLQSAGVQEGEALAKLYTGDLLDGFDGLDAAFDDWLLVERERLRRSVLAAIEVCLNIDPEDSTLGSLARALLDLEPTNEVAHRALMRAYAARGETSAALRQYQLCRDALERELDAELSNETELLAAKVRDGSIDSQTARLSRRSPAVSTRRSPQALVAVEPKGLVLGNVVDQSLAAALAADLREALSRIRWLSMIDTSLYFPVTSSDTHGGISCRLPEPSYHVSVSALRARDRVRLTTELKDAETARILWSGHHDHGIADDVFSIVDAVAAGLVCKLEQEIHLAETMRAARKPFEALSAYDCVLRAIPLIFKLTPESFAEAEKLLLRGQEADPHDSMVYAWRAFWYSIDIGQGWVQDLNAAKSELDFLVRRAMECDPKNALALSVAGHIAAYVNHDYERALTLYEQSLRLDPNSAYAWDSNAVTLCYAGKAKEALQQLDSSRDLWQQHADPYYFYTTYSIALLLSGRPHEAAAVGRRTVRENPNFQAALRPLIASLGLIGRVEEAQEYLADLRGLHPDFSIGWFRTNYPPLCGEAGHLYIEGLHRAGVEK